jgi:hypothetical protein
MWRAGAHAFNARPARSAAPRTRAVHALPPARRRSHCFATDRRIAAEDPVASRAQARGPCAQRARRATPRDILAATRLRIAHRVLSAARAPLPAASAFGSAQPRSVAAFSPETELEAHAVRSGDAEHLPAEAADVDDLFRPREPAPLASERCVDPFHQSSAPPAIANVPSPGASTRQRGEQRKDDGLGSFVQFAANDAGCYGHSSKGDAR